jgi:HSP20 family protein
MELTTTFDNELRKMNRLMDRWFHMGPSFDGSLASADWIPRVDIAEDDKAYTIDAELPEVKKNDVKVHVEDGMLTISGERRQEKETKSKKYHRVERSYGTFLRTFTLPADVDAMKIQSKFSDGMLEVVLPKNGEGKRSGKDIPIG